MYVIWTPCIEPSLYSSASINVARRSFFVASLLRSYPWFFLANLGHSTIYVTRNYPVKLAKNVGFLVGRSLIWVA